MRQRVEDILFFLLLLFLPTQLGKHFWTDFSKVHGIRVDYLSPTVYLTDVLVLCLAMAVLIGFVHQKRSFFVQNKLLFILLIITLCLFSYHALFAQSVGASSYGAVKFLEMLFIGWYVSQVGLEKLRTFLIKTFLITLPILSFLSLWQFFTQSSIGSVWYLLGERTFSSATAGIATFFLHGREILRPYATFSHPNVLAFYLLFGNVILLFSFKHSWIQKHKIYIGLVLVISSVVLFLTFSRVVSILYMSFLLYYFGFYKKMLSKRLFYIGISVFAVAVLLLLMRFSQTEYLIRDIQFRTELNRIAFLIWQQHPFIGVGLKNFFAYQIEYQKSLSPTLLQPVHNIYLLVLAEVGLVGFFAFVVFIIVSFKKVFENIKFQTENIFSKATLYLLLSALIVGLFDHYLLTIQQGQLMFTLILGLCWVRPIAR